MSWPWMDIYWVTINYLLEGGQKLPFLPESLSQITGG